MTTETTDVDPVSTAFENLGRYDWDGDTDFQNGIASILSTEQDAEQISQIILRAKCFYFSRKFDMPVDYDAYREWCARRTARSSVQGQHEDGPVQTANASLSAESSALNQDPQTGTASSSTPSAGPTTAGSSEQAPYPTSFAHIVDLISNGRPIPGIKEIPNTILEGQSSQTSARARRKPWEKDDAGSEHTSSDAPPLAAGGS